MRTVLVTGGTSNLGSALCRAFLEHGDQVVCTYTHNKDKAEKLVRELGEKLTIASLDILCEESIFKLFESLESLDILINNSGVFTVSEQENLLPSDWDKVFDTNVKGMFLVCKKAIPLLRKSTNGVIINIASMNAFHPGFGGTAHYDASKGAVVSYTKSLAAELGPSIRVNGVAPGLLDAPYLHDDTNTVRLKFEGRAILNRLVKAGEVADCALFLSSATAITGEVVTVDCGYSVG
ncbi:SDR family oxidoreductase [uncultured Sphaerochaeta sp.]|uniref:SDR family NAD(P)-dependent oxidoreductase n=1 Tax=uncultured Sphaerochaeta sp. TaxID=886478 RepID=UPI002A0A88AE|nr:SDR family oxidoreductase [uncultured Sphaerochaeta sp.]